MSDGIATRVDAKAIREAIHQVVMAAAVVISNSVWWAMRMAASATSRWTGSGW